MGLFIGLPSKISVPVTCAGRLSGAVSGQKSCECRRVKRRRARIVRHPENGGRLLVHESKTMKFRPSSLLWKE